MAAPPQMAAQSNNNDVTFRCSINGSVFSYHSVMNHQTVRIYCRSQDSEEHFSDNTAHDFRVNLGETLNIPHHWVCALTDITFSKSLKDTEYLCSDLCDTSVTASSGRLPILRRIPINWTTILPLVCVPVKKEHFNTIHFYLRDTKGKSISHLKGSAECAIVLKPGTPWTG